MGEMTDVKQSLKELNIEIKSIRADMRAHMSEYRDLKAKIAEKIELRKTLFAKAKELKTTQ